MKGRLEHEMENLKYSLKDTLLEADEKLTGSNSILGMSMLTQPMYNNSMRTVMFTSHLKQFVNLAQPDITKVFTHGENVAGDNSSGYLKAKHDTTIYRKVVKFADIIEQPTIYKLFVFDEEKQTFDVWTRRDCENLTEIFGYEYDNEFMDSLEENTCVKKGTIITSSKSYDDNMNYGYGKNVPIMYTLDPYTSEDACVCAESLDRDMASIEPSTVKIGINQNDFLLNIYGEDGEYKPFPDIGEYAHGEVAVKRTLFTNQLLTDFKDDSLTRISDSDICYYKSGVVTDITVHCNNPDIEENPFNAQALKYLRSQNKYYAEIKSVCKDIMKSGFKYTRNINYLYKRACEFLDEEKRWKDNDSIFNNLLIKIELKNTIGLQIGQKVTGRYGNKSVNAKTRPDSEMPYYYDDNGNKVVIKLLLNLLAIINRTTAFPIYEIAINFICNKVRTQLSNMKSLKEQEKLLFGIINDFNEIQYADMYGKYKKLSTKEKKEYIQDCIDDGIYIHQNPIYETKPIFFRLLDIYNKYDFLSPYDVYINKWGREIKTLNKAYIGEMYILKLKQTSRKGFSARGSGSINAKGLPERSYKNKSFTEPSSSTPIRFGEFETLNFSIGMDSEEIQLFHLMYRTSAKGRRDLAKLAFTSKGKQNKKSDNKNQFTFDSDNFKISNTYTSRVAEIFNDALLKSLGLRIDFIDEDEELQEYDDKEIKLFILDDKEYLCTEYQFMLVKRRRDIENEILKKYGIIDTDELNKLVMEELKNRNFIVGPDKSEYDITPGLQPDTLV